jgi:tetratricopeptide (TPR) repeat protein
MRRVFAILPLILLSNLTGFCQIKGDTIYYKQIEIRIYTYLLGKDTIVKSYFDKNAPRTIKKIKTNIGRVKHDLTFDSIMHLVRINYPSSSVTTTDLQTGKLTGFKTRTNPEFKSAITMDCYLIGAINYYSNEIAKDSNNYLSYYELANAYLRLNKTYSLSLFDKGISYINTSMRLNPAFEKAFVIKARLHEKNGIARGRMMSEPYVDIVDLNEIKQAIYCLDNLLRVNPDYEEGKQYRMELMDKYGSKYKL